MIAQRKDVENCYRLVLNRAIDPSGVDHWMRYVERTGATARDVLMGFLRSEEFRTANPEFAPKARGLTTADCTIVDFHGLSLMVNPREPIMAGLVHHQTHSPWIIRAMHSLIRDGDTFVDVGANCGVLGIYAGKKLTPSGQVTFIEPFVDNVKLIMANILLNKLENWRVLPVALDSRQGAVFSFVEEWSNRHVSSDSIDAVSTIDHVDVFPAVTLDSILGELPRVDVMRMDIEGFEGRALLGAGAVIRKFRPKIIMEYCPEYYAGREISAHGCLEIGFGYGYKASIVCREKGLIPIGRNIAEIDAYFQAHPDWNWIDVLFH